MDHESAEWDVINTYFSRDGRFRVTGINQDGSIVIRVVEVLRRRGSWRGGEKPVRASDIAGGGDSGRGIFADQSPHGFLCEW